VVWLDFGTGLTTSRACHENNAARKVLCTV
jgi:hypothetical protein